MNQLQTEQFEILTIVADFCEKNDITYFLVSGTLLGAARHGGFIPWDDDIDIGMDPYNYKKFNKLAPDYFSNIGYFVQNYRTQNKYGFAWTKVRKNGTTSMENNLRNYHIHYGIDIDIFVYSGIENGTIKRKVQERAFTEYKKILKKHYLLAKNGGRKPNHSYIFLIPDGLRKLILRLLEPICFTKLDDKSCCFDSFSYHPFYPAEMFISKNLIKLNFEEREFWAPKDYKDYLTIKYGDWEELPPINQRYNHGDIITDFENDYKMYWI